MKIKLFSSIALIALLSACASNGSMNASSSDFDSIIKQAIAENAKAKKVGFEWRDTGKMIKKAKKLAASGDTEKAIKLAKKAKKQAMDAQAQAVAQASPTPRY